MRGPRQQPAAAPPPPAPSLACALRVKAAPPVPTTMCTGAPGEQCSAVALPSALVAGMDAWTRRPW